jgi:hypothetical protein
MQVSRRFFGVDAAPGCLAGLLMLTPGDVSVLVRLLRLQGIEEPTAINRKPAHGQPSKPDARRPCGFCGA